MVLMDGPVTLKIYEFSQSRRACQIFLKTEPLPSKLYVGVFAKTKCDRKMKWWLAKDLVTRASVYLVDEWTLRKFILSSHQYFVKILMTHFNACNMASVILHFVEIVTFSDDGLSDNQGLSCKWSLCIMLIIVVK